MVVERVDSEFGRDCRRRTINPVPLFQAAQRSCVGIVRVQRQQHQLIERRCSMNRGHRISRERFPVSHGCRDDRLHVGRKRGGQFCSLPFGQQCDRRSPSDHGVAATYRRRAPFRDVVRERAAQKSQWSHRNDVWIEEQIAQKRLHGLERIWSAQLKQHNSDAHLHSASWQRCISAAADYSSLNRLLFRRSTSDRRSLLRFTTLRKNRKNTPQPIMYAPKMLFRFFTGPPPRPAKVPRRAWSFPENTALPPKTMPKHASLAH